jgi:hypothetical protein
MSRDRDSASSRLRTGGAWQERIGVKRARNLAHRLLGRPSVSFCHAGRRMSQRLRDLLKTDIPICEATAERVAQVMRPEPARDAGELLCEQEGPSPGVWLAAMRS